MGKTVCAVVVAIGFLSACEGKEFVAVEMQNFGGAVGQVFTWFFSLLLIWGIWSAVRYLISLAKGKKGTR